MSEINNLVNADTTNEVVTKGRNVLCKQMAEKARAEIAGYGIELIDIVADLLERIHALENKTPLSEVKFS